MNKIASAAAALVVLALSFTPALAVTEGPYTQTVSCDAAYTDTLKTFFHASTGTLAFTKDGDTNGYITEAVNAYSSLGNGVGWKTVSSSSHSVSWTSVLSSSYTFVVKPSTSVNCNGILPGNGNTDLTYKVWHL